MSLRGVRSSHSIETPDVSLDGMTDRILRGKIGDLMEAFPLKSPVEIRNALTVSNGSLDGATDILLGSPGSSSSSFGGSMDSTSSWNKTATVKEEDYETLEDITIPRWREKVAGLKELGISQSISFVVDVLKDCGWNVNEAANILLSDSISPQQSPAINIRSGAEGISQVTGHSTSVETLAKPANASLPLPPSTPKVQAQQYFGGIIPSFQISLRTENAPAQAKSRQISPPPSMDTEEIDPQNPALTPSSTDVLDNDTEVDEQEESMESKAAQLRELLPQASQNRCERFLQIYDSMDEAYAALEEELAEDGSDNMSYSETQEDDEGVDDQLRNDPKISNGKATGTAQKGKSQEKRHAESPDTRPSKKSRVVHEDEDEDELEPAGVWVKRYFSESGGYSILLDCGLHDCKFPKAILENFKFFKDNFTAGSTDGTSPGLELRLSNVGRETFDLAVQWTVCKRIKLGLAQRTIKSTEISAVLELALLAANLGLPGTELDLAAYLKRVLVRYPTSLEPLHIQTAFTLNDSHPICQLFIQAALRPYAEFYHNNNGRLTDSNDSDSEDEENLDAARRSFYLKSKFKFHREFKSLKDFRYALLEEFHKAWWHREIEEIRYGRLLYDKTHMMDPLTGVKFTV